MSQSAIYFQPYSRCLPNFDPPRYHLNRHHVYLPSSARSSRPCMTAKKRIRCRGCRSGLRRAPRRVSLPFFSLKYFSWTICRTTDSIQLVVLLSAIVLYEKHKKFDIFAIVFSFFGAVIRASSESDEVTSLIHC